MDSSSKSLKGRFPFRLGTVSYILPEDILPNVRYLADRIDDIELVLFESDEISNIPDKAAIAGLASIAGEKDLTYTVHLPLDVFLGAREEKRRTASVEKCLRVIERTLPLEPFSYILHFHGDRRGASPSPDIPLWKAQHRLSLERLLKAVPGPMLAVETLDYPFRLVEDIVAEFGLSVCLDAGHIWLNGYDLEEAIERYADRIRVIHLHGVEGGVDHKDISSLSESQIGSVIAAAEAGEAERVLTLEMFSEAELEKSLQILRRLIAG